MRHHTALRLAAASVGAILLTGVAGAAFAEEPPGADSVDIQVQIAEIDEPGVLAMTIDGTATSLTETGSTATVRQFTGTLPTVTITDTRTPDEIPDGAAWYVLGSAGAFTGDAGQPEIGAEHLGWAPRLIDGDDEGLISEGDVVDTVLDEGANAVGLVGQELFAMAAGSAEVAAGDSQWTATAGLTLKTGADVAPGSYVSTVTLSLFE